MVTGDAHGLLSLDLSTNLPLPNVEGGVDLRVGELYKMGELGFCSVAAFSSNNPSYSQGHYSQL